MTHVLDAEAVLAVLDHRPQPAVTRLRQLNAERKEPRYAVATLVGQWHRKFPFDYRKQFNQAVPDWIWVEHPQTIIDLCKLAMQERRLLPDRSPEPPSELQKTQKECLDLISALEALMLESTIGLPCPEYDEWLRLQYRLHAVETDEIARSMARHPQLTRETAEEMARAFGFL